MLNPSSYPEIIHIVKTAGITYLEEDALLDLYNLVRDLEEEQIEGILVEAGCALGGSAIVMTSAKNKERRFNIYDVFGMIPPPSENDDVEVHQRYQEIAEGKSKGIKGEKYYGYEEDLIEKVKSNFDSLDYPVEENNVSLIKGLFQDTLHLDSKVALAHIDGDWYESVKICLERVTPKLSTGGILVIDDYEAWSGCRKAVDEYFENKKENFEFVQKSRLHIIKK